MYYEWAEDYKGKTRVYEQSQSESGSRARPNIIYNETMLMRFEKRQWKILYIKRYKIRFEIYKGNEPL